MEWLFCVLVCLWVYDELNAKCAGGSVTGFSFSPYIDSFSDLLGSRIKCHVVVTVSLTALSGSVY